MKTTFFLSITTAALYHTLTVFAQSSNIGGLSTPDQKETPAGEEAHYGPGHVDPVSEYQVPSTLQQILVSNETAWSYPTDFTRNIMPRFMHSHNDYWRDVPYYSALSVGAVSIEADIWLINGTLHVGHEESALTSARTLQSLYLDPIMDTLRRQNPTSPFVKSTTHNGVFDTDSAQTLYLWFDCKTESISTFSAALAAIQPLREGGYLTTWSPESGITPGAVTIIGTGNTPPSFFLSTANASVLTTPRDYFFDAELTEIGAGGTQQAITSNQSVIASTDFGSAIGMVGQGGTDGILSSAQLSALRSQIGVAKAKGIGARYWGTPEWPTRVRNGVMRALWENGVALVNVDDLTAGAFDEW